MAKKINVYIPQYEKVIHSDNFSNLIDEEAIKASELYKLLRRYKLDPKHLQLLWGESWAYFPKIFLGLINIILADKRIYADCQKPKSACYVHFDNIIERVRHSSLMESIPQHFDMRTWMFADFTKQDINIENCIKNLKGLAFNLINKRLGNKKILTFVFRYNQSNLCEAYYYIVLLVTLFIIRSQIINGRIAFDKEHSASNIITSHLMLFDNLNSIFLKVIYDLRKNIVGFDWNVFLKSFTRLNKFQRFKLQLLHKIPEIKLTFFKCKDNYNEKNIC